MDIALPKNEGPPVASGRVIPLPNGKEAALVVRNGQGGYDKTIFAGPTLQTSSHILEDIDSLVRWAKRNLVDTETGEILVSTSHITADPDPEDESASVATMRLQDHFRLTRWKKAFQGSMTAMMFRKVLLDGADDTEELVSEAGKVVGRRGTQMAQAVSKMKVSQSGSVTVEVSDLGFIEAHGSSGKTVVDVRLDPVFRIKVPMYLGVLDSSDIEPLYELDVRINVDVNQSGDVLFSLSPTNLDAAYQSARKDIAASIASKLAPKKGSLGIYVGLGTRQIRQFVGDVPSLVSATRVLGEILEDAKTWPAKDAPKEPEAPPQEPAKE